METQRELYTLDDQQRAIRLVGRLVVTHQDRLLRFGAELVFAICEAKHIEVRILNQGEDTTVEEELAPDVLEIITVFSAGSTAADREKISNCSMA